MTFKRAKRQIENKPLKLARFMKFNKPKERKHGKGAVSCRICGKTEGVINKYGLHFCRQCFREQAERLGFKKYS